MSEFAITKSQHGGNVLTLNGHEYISSCPKPKGVSDTFYENELMCSKESSSGVLSSGCICRDVY